VTGGNGVAPGPGYAAAPDAVTVAYVHSNEVAYSWHHSMVEMIGFDMAGHGRIIRGGYIAMRCGATGLVEARNGTVREFLDTRDADWLLWVDTDMGFPADLCERLLEAADPQERPVVGALCFSQRETESDGMGGWRCLAAPTIFDWAVLPSGRQGFLIRWDYPRDTVVRCAGTGSAAVLVHRSVFERIAEGKPEGWAHWYDMAPNPTTGQLIGEDLSFCARAGALEIPVHVHTGVPTSHQKRLWLCEDDYHRERLTDPAALLRGRARSVLFGKPLELAVSWPEGTPDGMGEAQRAAAADMMDAERGRLAAGQGTEPKVSEPAGASA
jgi:hypothetical protein